MNKGKQIVLKAGLVLLGFFLGLVLMEVAVRVYLKLTEPISDKACREKDELLHHALKPLSRCRSRTTEWDIKFEVNSLGLRDYEYQENKPDGSYRILMLGDSFTEGYGVELDETFSKLLEKKLNTALDGKIEVINAGVSGYSPILELLYLKNKGLELKPDLVILNYTMTDYYDDWQYKNQLLPSKKKEVEWEAEKMYTEVIPQTTWLPFIPTSLKWWLHQHLVSYDFISLRLKKIFNPEVYKENIKEFEKGDILTDQFAITREEITSEDYQKLISNTQDYLLEIRNLLAENNIDFILSIIPYGHQVNQQEWSQGRNYWQFEKNKLYSSKCIGDLEAWAKDNNIAVLDLLNVYQKPSTQLNYFPIDGHWNKKGHIIAAEEMYKSLIKRLK
jgi:hypothetical protein